MPETPTKEKFARTKCRRMMFPVSIAIKTNERVAASALSKNSLRKTEQNSFCLLRPLLPPLLRTTSSHSGLESARQSRVIGGSWNNSNGCSRTLPGVSRYSLLWFARRPSRPQHYGCGLVSLLVGHALLHKAAGDADSPSRRVRRSHFLRDQRILDHYFAAPRARKVQPHLAPRLLHSSRLAHLASLLRHRRSVHRRGADL